MSQYQRQGRFSLKSSSFRVIIWPPFSSDFRLTTRALHWDRGRPARSVTILSFEIESSALEAGVPPAPLRYYPSRLSLLALEAGGTPAVPVKSLEWSIHKKDLKTENEPVPNAGYS